MSVKLYTSLSVVGLYVDKIDDALKILRVKNINYHNTYLSVYDIALLEKKCSETSKVIEKKDFHISVGTIKYTCDITLSALQNASSERDRCIKSIKKEVLEKFKDINSFTLKKTINEIDYESLYGFFEAISLEQNNQNNYIIKNPHLSIIKGGNSQDEADKCLSALMAINRQYHPGAEHDYYKVINSFVGNSIETYSIDITINRELNDILHVDLRGHDEF